MLGQTNSYVDVIHGGRRKFRPVALNAKKTRLLHCGELRALNHADERLEDGHHRRADLSSGEDNKIPIKPRLLNIEKRLCHQAQKVKPKNVQK